MVRLVPLGAQSLSVVSSVHGQELGRTLATPPVDEWPSAFGGEIATVPGDLAPVLRAYRTAATAASSSSSSVSSFAASSSSFAARAAASASGSSGRAAIDRLQPARRAVATIGHAGSS
jgi:hypothetical protein